MFDEDELVHVIEATSRSRAVKIQNHVIHITSRSWNRFFEVRAVHAHVIVFDESSPLPAYMHIYIQRTDVELLSLLSIASIF